MKEGTFKDIVEGLIKDLNKAKEEGFGALDISQTWDYPDVTIKLTVVLKEEDLSSNSISRRVK